MKIKITLKSLAAAALILHFTLYTLHSHAAEPLCWERTPNRPAPAQFDTFHGTSLDFRCTFTGFGAPPFAAGEDVRLWYQTNGMGAAWWSVPATVSSNALFATFPPGADPGAERLSVFFGAPSNAYAAAQVRFRNSPGTTPNELQPPSVLDWQAELSAATNALATNVYTKGETDAKIVELSPIPSLEPATNHTDEAISRLSDELSNGDFEVAQARDAHFAEKIEDTYHLTYRTGTEIFSQIDSKTTTNDVLNIITNETAAWVVYKVWFEGDLANQIGTFYITDVEWHTGGGSFKVDGVSYDITYDEEYDGYVLGFYVNGVTIFTDSPYVDYGTTPPNWELIALRPEPFAEDYDRAVETQNGPRRNALGFARISDLPSTNGIITAASVTNTVRTVAYAVNDYIFDGDVCWRRQMLQGGYLEYVAVTNIDVTLPENYKALEALEKARRNQE